jgi:hypothetical protein
LQSARQSDSEWHLRNLFSLIRGKSQKWFQRPQVITMNGEDYSKSGSK